MKRFLSLVLAAVLVFSAAAVGGSAVKAETARGGNGEFYPTIIIPGLGQSNVWLLDDDGNYVLDKDGKRVNCFPAYVQTDKVIKKALLPLLLTLITQRDIGLSKALADAVELCFSINASDVEGNPKANIEVEKYPYSVAECSEYEREQIYNSVPLDDFDMRMPENLLYYFSYNSFGDNISIVNELYDFIQKVKRETGYDKVNIVPISLGGTVANGLLEYYPRVKDELHKVIYIVPALDGSTIVGDVFNGELTFYDADYLYNGFLEELMDEDQARLIESVARLFPNDVLMKCLRAVAERLVGSVMTTSSNLWALVPSKDYPRAARKWLSSPERAELKRRTDRYYEAQLNSDANIKRLVDGGVKVFNIVDYGVNLYNVGNSWDDSNADGVIHLDSTSMGACAARPGEKLPEGYVQKNTNCSNPAHNHISPDGSLDASAGLLPDHTFYFAGQNHEKTGRNDIIIRLALRLIESDDIEDVYTDPAFPQFNGGRSLGRIYDRLRDIEKIDRSALTPEETDELDAAAAEARAFIESTVCRPGDDERIEARLTAVLVNAGVYETKDEEKKSDFFKKLSLWLYGNYGVLGYSEMWPVSANLFFKTINEIINGGLAPLFGKINDIF